jgi:hypothetical protein
MDDLLNPPAPIEAEERVLNTMELGEDIRLCISVYLMDDLAQPTSSHRG